MKIKFTILIYVAIIIIAIIMLCNLVINNYIVNKYHAGKYLENQAKLLTNINFQINYVANYNYGNILYQNGEYEKAIQEYKKALKTVLSSDRECSIIINCALALCKTVKLDETSQESISNAIDIYESAIEILTERNCDEHNQDANTLKKDIQDEIDRLKKLQTNTDNEELSTDKEESQVDEENIEEKIKDIKEQAIEKQRNTESVYNTYNRSYTGRENNW